MLDKERFWKALRTAIICWEIIYEEQEVQGRWKEVKLLSKNKKKSFLKPVHFAILSLPLSQDKRFGIVTLSQLVLYLEN